LHTKGEHHPRVYKAIAAIETVLAQPAQEPLDQTSHDAQRKPLTDEQIYAMCSDFHSWSEWDGGNFQKSWLDLCRAIEAAHGIKETTK
jgi:hypothetical protein